MRGDRERDGHKAQQWGQGPAWEEEGITQKTQANGYRLLLEHYGRQSRVE